MSQKCLADFHQLIISAFIMWMQSMCCFLCIQTYGVHILSFSLVACGTLVNSAKDASADGRLELCVCVRCLYSHLGTQWWPQTCCVWLHWAWKLQQCYWVCDSVLKQGSLVSKSYNPKILVVLYPVLWMNFVTQRHWRSRVLSLAELWTTNTVGVPKQRMLWMNMETQQCGGHAG